MKHGDSVRAFESAFADYCGARYAIACSNGTVTLQGALHALGVQPGDRVATTPLTMAATTIAILNVGAVPVYCDVDPKTWLICGTPNDVRLIVSLYGLHQPYIDPRVIDDAAQTLRRHSGAAFTSYSFQASKILPLGEGGMLVTNYEDLAERARSYLSLGYKMAANQSRIDSSVIKSPTYARHHLPMSINGRMADLVAVRGINQLAHHFSEGPHRCYADLWKAERLEAAGYYRDAIAGCSWLTPQYVPEGWGHDYWAYTVAVGRAGEGKHRTIAHEILCQAIVRHGGERPYGAWRLTYQEPAFRNAHWLDRSKSYYPCWGTNGPRGLCPVAEDLQPRLLQGQTNNLESAKRNADAWAKAITEVGG